MHSRTRTSSVVVAALLLFVDGCGTEAKKDLAKTAIGAMSDEQRRDAFEATVRMLDEKPEHVDEFYAVAHRHDRTMQRFLANAARDLRDPRLATMTAQLLAQHPDSVEQTLVSAVDEIAKVPESRAAMNRAMAKRADVAVDILTDDANALTRLTESALRVLDQKPAARKNVLAAASRQRSAIVALIENEPKLAKEMTKELLRAAVEDKPWLAETLRSLGVTDEKRPADAKSKR